MLELHKHIRRGGQCRRCINERYDLNLQPYDCRYMIYASPCTGCGELSNIVEGVRFTGFFKLLWNALFRKKRNKRQHL